MSCGTGIWWVTDYDRDIMWNVYVPDVPSHVGAVNDGAIIPNAVTWGLFFVALGLALGGVAVVQRVVTVGKA